MEKSAVREKASPPRAPGSVNVNKTGFYGRFTERVVERHHDGEPADEAQGRHIGRSAADGLGDQFLDDDIEHGTGRSGHPVREKRRRGENTSARRGRRREVPRPQRAAPRRMPGPATCRRIAEEGDGQALWDVLQSDADRERRRGTQIASTEADAHSQAFREIVQGHGQHQERRPPPRDAWSLGDGSFGNSP